MNNTSRFSSQNGFTLMEVVIVMGIMAFLTINIAINLKNAFSARTRIQTKLEDFSKLRDGLRIMEKDINLAFHYRDLETEYREALSKAQNPQATATPNPMLPPGFGAPTMPAGGPAMGNLDPKAEERKRNRLNPVTQFEGTESSINFVTLNSNRMTQDQKQADFIKVGYKLGSCRRPGATKSTQCILRRDYPIVEGKVTDDGEETVLMEDVTEFKLRYFGKGKQDWTSDWKSEQGDAVTKGSYPQAVEISVTTESGEEGKTRKVSMQIIAAVRFANNAEKKNQQQNSGMPTM